MAFIPFDWHLLHPLGGIEEVIRSCTLDTEWTNAALFEVVGRFEAGGTFLHEGERLIS